VRDVHESIGAPSSARALESADNGGPDGADAEPGADDSRCVQQRMGSPVPEASQEPPLRGSDDLASRPSELAAADNAVAVGDAADATTDQPRDGGGGADDDEGAQVSEGEGDGEQAGKPQPAPTRPRQALASFASEPLARSASAGATGSAAPDGGSARQIDSSMAAALVAAASRVRVAESPALPTFNVTAARDELEARRILDGARARSGAFGREPERVLTISRDRSLPASFTGFVREMAAAHKPPTRVADAGPAGSPRPA
jgi:hypothetical protein